MPFSLNPFIYLISNLPIDILLQHSILLIKVQLLIAKLLSQWVCLYGPPLPGDRPWKSCSPSPGICLGIGKVSSSGRY